VGDVAEQEAADALARGRVATGVRLLDEGSCKHLACRSSYSQDVACDAAGAIQCRDGCKKVSFACRQAGACDNSVAWVVRPRTAGVACGASLRVCYAGRNTVAPVWDTADANNHWEASRGLQDALGMPYGQNGRVNIYTEGDTRWQDDPACVRAAPPDPPPPPPGGGSVGQCPYSVVQMEDDVAACEECGGIHNCQYTGETTVTCSCYLAGG
jgi:hypothetical protein